ncbi:hypothetical protein IQ238_11110 [Pleurocapsales cyanobacterium LEGE 06147]|nr:hypothetical protein [Pleurocapsales cyanobacterium LEGE 06147]
MLLRNTGILSIVVVGLVGCQQLSDFGIRTFLLTPISAIEQKKDGARVYLQGKVTHKAPFLGSGAYQLKDDSGSVWIVTTDTIPPVGEAVVIKGTVQYQSLPLAEQDWGEFYILELKQLEMEVTSR